MSSRPSRAPGIPGTSPQAIELRAAGLGVASARLAVLRVALQLFASGPALGIKALPGPCTRMATW